jgi:hypothetical protein
MTTPQPSKGTNRPDPRQPELPATEVAASHVGPETWVRDAIAEQEEHIKRWRSCMDTLGRAHAYREVTASGSATYRACAVCGVTETREDYAAKINATTQGKP